MTTMHAPGLNGRTKKTLSNQLDRLDEILDGFADALQESVRDAVAASVGGVVRDAVAVAVREVLSAQAQARMQMPMTPTALPAAVIEVAKVPAPVAQPSRWARFRAKVSAIAQRLRATVAKLVAPMAKTVVGRVIRGTVLTLSLAKFGVALVRGDRRAGRWGAVAGLAAGLTCGVGHPVIAGLVGGSAVGLLTIAALVTAPLWRPWLAMMREMAAVKAEVNV